MLSEAFLCLFLFPVFSVLLPDQLHRKADTGGFRWPKAPGASGDGSHCGRGGRASVPAVEGI